MPDAPNRSSEVWQVRQGTDGLVARRAQMQVRPGPPDRASCCPPLETASGRFRGRPPEEAADEGVEDEVDLGSSGARVRRAGDVQRGAVEAAESDVGERVEGHPSEGGGAEHDDAAEGGLEAGVEEGRQAGVHRVPGCGLGRGRRHDAGDHLALDAVTHGAEQRLLPREVVVQRAAGHPRLLDDVVDRRRRVAVLREVVPRHLDQERARGLRLADPQGLDGHRSPYQVDRQSVTDLESVAAGEGGDVEDDVVVTAIGLRNVPDAIRRLDTLATPDYADVFTVVTSRARDRSAEAWARAVLEGT